MNSLFSDISVSSVETDTFYFERVLKERGFSSIAGCDEVGRGPLAGPVVAAAVILPDGCDHTLFDDSKKLSHPKRLTLCQLLRDIGAAIGIGIVDRQTIEEINILQASLLAMKIAVEDLSQQSTPADFVLVDGKFTIPLSLSQEALIKGDSRSASISAASIVAKVTRDEIMEGLHKEFPHYQFHKNKGYPTKHHRAAIAAHGPCPHHRTTFKGVREFV